MGRLSLAFKSFFGILFGSGLPAEVAAAFGFVKEAPKKAEPRERASDGALQMLSLLQRDARLVDFLMEDITAYSDEQVGAAVRALHSECRATLERYLKLTPVIDGVEGTFTKLVSAGVDPKDPASVKFLGNVPAGAPPEGGLLRHRGWRADKVDLPPIGPGQKVSILAPAEIEVE